MALFLGGWIICIQCLMPSDGTNGPLAFGLSKTSRIALAARLGVWRSDLWAEDAVIRSGLTPEAGSSQPLPDDRHIAAAQEAARRSLALGPLNAKLWLLLAMQPSSSGVDTFDNTAALEMSYLTDQRNTDLFPARFSVAARSLALKDKEIQEFVKTDIEREMIKNPDVKSILLRVYQESSSDNRDILYEIYKDKAPVTLESIRSK